MDDLTPEEKNLLYWALYHLVDKNSLGPEDPKSILMENLLDKIVSWRIDK